MYHHHHHHHDYHHHIPTILPGTVLHAGDTKMNEKSSCPEEADILGGYFRGRQKSKLLLYSVIYMNTDVATMLM